MDGVSPRRTDVFASSLRLTKLRLTHIIARDWGFASESAKYFAKIKNITDWRKVARFFDGFRLWGGWGFARRMNPTATAWVAFARRRRVCANLYTGRVNPASTIGRQYRSVKKIKAHTPFVKEHEKCEKRVIAGRGGHGLQNVGANCAVTARHGARVGMYAHGMPLQHVQYTTKTCIGATKTIAKHGVCVYH